MKGLEEEIELLMKNKNVNEKEIKEKYN